VTTHARVCMCVVDQLRMCCCLSEEMSSWLTSASLASSLTLWIRRARLLERRSGWRRKWSSRHRMTARSADNTSLISLSIYLPHCLPASGNVTHCFDNLQSVKLLTRLGVGSYGTVTYP